MCFISSSSTNRSQRYTCRTYRAFVNRVSPMWHENAFTLCTRNHGQCHTVLRGISSTIEKFGFGQNLTASGIAERLQLYERSVADQPFDSYWEFFFVCDRASPLSRACLWQ